MSPSLWLSNVFDDGEEGGQWGTEAEGQIPQLRASYNITGICLAIHDLHHPGILMRAYSEPEALALR